MAENIDKVDVTVHLFAKARDSKEFYRKPVPEGMTPPGGRNRRDEWNDYGSTSHVSKPSSTFHWGDETAGKSDEEILEPSDDNDDVVQYEWRRRRKRSPLIRQGEAWKKAGIMKQNQTSAETTTVKTTTTATPKTVIPTFPSTDESPTTQRSEIVETEDPDIKLRETRDSLPPGNILVEQTTNGIRAEFFVSPVPGQLG